MESETGTRLGPRNGGTGLRVALIIAISLLLGTCSEPPPLLTQVKTLGELRVVTRNSPTTYYIGPQGATGFEYDLAHLFADFLGVRLRIIVPDNFGGVLRAVADGKAHLAAAGLSITPSRQKRFRFGPPYQMVTQELVYRYGKTRPRDPADLAGGKLVAISGSSHADELEQLKKEYPALSWTEDPDAESDELLAEVAQGDIDYAIADSNELALDRRYYPELRVGFDLKDPEPIAWAFKRGSDVSLYQAAVAFFAHIQADGQLAQVIERHYGHTDDFDYVGTRIFIRHISSRLPAYRSLFQEASADTGIDWRLLAAMGYQESHWDPRAVSPTGVRGIMMLTEGTASNVGVSNRVNPKESIVGGARYFEQLKSRLSDEIPEPDRTWMALAAYNVGLGHVEDARILTAKRGGDPDRWIDVREALPLLSQRKWYKQTEYGYARGREPVIYVANIRSYYDILAWMTSQHPTATPPPEDDSAT